ncbi:MAG: MOSC domain-containing protein [Candidatus Obscuribacter sp.]|nr:MOSC domain-containing protein [Candidatus Obscuribacter sp.]
MEQLKVSSLHIYPVKSLGGISLERMPLSKRGPLFDREWMIVNATGHFLSQREIARMCLISCRLTGLTERGKIETAAQLVLHIPACAPVEIPMARSTATEEIEVVVWRDKCLAQVEPEATEALSQYLQEPVRLVRMSRTFTRQVDENYATAADTVGFADGFPMLVISDASLSDLNNKLEYQVEMSRFRPNLTVSGATPFAEDTWKKLQLDSVRMELVKPCSRCQITTIDQDSADTGKEPLRTLSGYRKIDGKVMFGQNALVRYEGDFASIRLGETITVA